MDPAAGLGQRIIPLEDSEQLCQGQTIRPFAACRRHQVLVVGADRGLRGQRNNTVLIERERQQEVFYAVHSDAAVVHDVVDQRTTGARNQFLDLYLRI